MSPRRFAAAKRRFADVDSFRPAQRVTGIAVRPRWNVIFSHLMTHHRMHVFTHFRNAPFLRPLHRLAQGPIDLRRPTYLIWDFLRLDITSPPTALHGPIHTPTYRRGRLRQRFRPFTFPYLHLRRRPT